MTTTSQPRARSIVQIIDAAFRLYRNHFGLFFRTASFLMVSALILSFLVAIEPISASLLNIIQSLATTLLLAPAIIYIANQVLAAQPPTVGEAYAVGWRNSWRIFLMSLLQGLVVIAILLIPLIIIGIIAFALMNNLGSSASAWIIIVFGGIAGLASIIASARWYVALPCIIIEGIGASDALSRSWELTRGRFWRISGIALLTGLLALLIAGVPQIVFNPVIWINWVDGQNLTWLTIANTALSQLGRLLIMPFSYSVAVLTYYDLRIRNEGADLEQQIAQAGSQVA